MMATEASRQQKARLDMLMLERGIVKSRERAKGLIMSGKVTVNGAVMEKAGTAVDVNADIAVLGDETPFVSRGGVKLDAALTFFNLNPEGMTAMDIGCSTGGFTDCLLKRGAGHVYAVDVGYGQFDWSLRQDPRVILMEKTNIRYLEKESVPAQMDIIVIDVSFISLLKVLPRALDFLKEDGVVVALVKPQFEVGKGMVEKGGVIKDDKKRMAAVDTVIAGAAEQGFIFRGVCESPVRGQKGNIEYFICLGRH